MKKFMAYVFLLLVQCEIVKSQSLPKAAFSPNKLYSVEIAENSKKSSTDDDKIVVLKAKGKILAEETVSGYLREVFWSIDKKYVAVNIGTAYYGDRLWVFSLSRGEVIRKPYDDMLMSSKSNIISEFSGKEIFREYIEALGWTIDDILLLKKTYLFKNESTYVEIISNCSINNNRLTVNNEKVNHKKRDIN